MKVYPEAVCPLAEAMNDFRVFSLVDSFDHYPRTMMPEAKWPKYTFVKRTIVNLIGHFAW